MSLSFQRDVFVLSTIHGNQIEEVQRRDDEEKVTKPKMITEYNCYMNGVDKCDQMLASYSIQRKTTKWWKKLFFRLIELSIINAMIVFDNLFPGVLPRRHRNRAFRTTLIHELVQPLLDDKDSQLVDYRQVNLIGIRLRGKHFATSRHPEKK